MDFIPKEHEGGDELKKKNQKANWTGKWKKDRTKRICDISIIPFQLRTEVQLKPCIPFFSFGDRQVAREDYVLGKDKR